ncbi:MAG TPA: SDR family oxidoreductase [Smithellaceae bacterium]|nr:SDR family oxidoreductase [Smithellaceae bacterium]
MMQNDNYLGWKKPGIAMITGATAGLGLCFAGHLAQKGFDLVLAARRRDRLDSIAANITAQYGIRCETIFADLANMEEIRKTADYVKQIENLDILINNAGFATIGAFAEVPLEKTMQMFHLHMASSVLLAHAALPAMLKKKRGAIINLSSIAAFTLTPGNVMYDATKSFLVTFSENLQLEVRNAGIRVQALCPGFTRTEFHEVGDFKNFDRSVVPNTLWMTADKVVSLSLKALKKNKNVVFIPGWKNRLLTWLITHSKSLQSIAQNRVKERDLQI